jgi:hypothetical protein
VLVGLPAHLLRTFSRDELLPTLESPSAGELLAALELAGHVGVLEPADLAGTLQSALRETRQAAAIALGQVRTARAPRR